VNSYEVQIWEITKRTDRKGRPWRVRWAVAGQRREQLYRTKALANSFRSDLVKAANAGEPFDVASGGPLSALRAAKSITWYAHARGYVAVKWPHAAPKYRKSIVEALVTVTVALVRPTQRGPDADVLRRGLYLYGLNPRRWEDDLPTPEAEALKWLEGSSLLVSELDQAATVRKALDACATRLDNRPSSATVVRRKRAVFYNAMSYAVECELLDSNPIDRVRWKAPEVAETVDRRVVANPQQVRALLQAVGDVGVRGERLVAFFGCLYYAGTRPSEAADICEGDCYLPEFGWGHITLVESSPRSGAHWTDDGRPRQRRGLKHRGQGETRTVPIPAKLVSLLRDHIERYGVGVGGRLFRGARGGDFPDTEYAKVWRMARQTALTSEQVASPLARRPYDLRHAAASLWLNSGVPATEVARRLGHGVAVLLRVYANCISEQQDSMNDRIDGALGD
jgi:integrase